MFILIGILFVGYIYSQNYHSQSQNVKGGYQKNIDQTIQEKYSGDFTNEKVKIIIADYLLSRQQEAKDEDFSFYPFYWEMGQTFIKGGIPSFSDYLNTSLENDTPLSIEDIPLKKIETLNFKKFDKPLKLGNFVPWTDLFKVTGHVFILSSILVILICSQLFSEDTSKNINQLLFTTKYGRNKMNSSKIGVGIIVSVALLLFFQLINFGVLSFLFDLSGGSSNIQTNFSFDLGDFPLAWTHWQVYFFILGLQIIGILFIASLSFFASALSKTPMAAFALSLAIYFLPSLLKELIRNGLVNKLLFLFPINFSNPKNVMLLLSSDNYIFDSFILNASLLFLFLLISKLVLDIISYLRMKNWKFS
ncbi:hypothetical protein RV15_GL003024 [Enterococcus silesiacus]|uniref:Uncharacterized protein n=1 Tax=Enterococcus silesiacus TaxID=332949 RepID=A0AA91GFY0_9ENTE|nr:hypothetical protein RV15_GL003024 [Enterococcus silesiacus]